MTEKSLIIRFMTYISRAIESNITQALKRGKSILLLGPRQTGKTTMIKQALKPDIHYSFAKASTRQRYEHNPALLEAELIAQIKTYTHPPLICIDEVQKIPRVMDVAQFIIDEKMAQFILTGSSARKLRHNQDINLLPGRVVSQHMTPLLLSEMSSFTPTLEDLLLYGSLPDIALTPDYAAKETDLLAYVTTYLEQEIRSEALVRNVGNFARFLQIAAGEAGKQLNFTRLSQDIGIADTTIANYYQILEDCLIVLRIDPITDSHTKRRLIKSPKYLFFDLGIRRAAANESTALPLKMLAELFEHYVGNELVYQSQLHNPHIKVKYWRDTAGPEIDYVLDISQRYLPIEVKWSENPNLSDAKHLIKFMQEYPDVKMSYIISRTPQAYQLADKITVLPWQAISSIFKNY
jgi:predicted AAA+ superfamily ATPase